jgi:2-methylcitrate dehydratase PrpD
MPDTHVTAPPLAVALGHAIVAARSAGFADAARAKLRACLADFLGCAFEASSLPWSRRAAALAEADGPCSIVGAPRGASLIDAAFANAVAGHGLVREDMHAGAVAHLGVVVLPALLALAEQRGKTLSHLADAAIIGYEVGAKLGRAIVTPEFSRSFRPTGFVGPAAAAAACAALLGLDATQTQSALSLAANMASGLNQWPHTGADDMFFHPGIATRNGITAARLAELGAYGSERALDGEAGLLTAMRPDRTAPPLALFDGEPEILSVFFKPVPVCNFAQTPALAALDLVRENRIEPAEIARVRLRVTRAAKIYPGCDHAGPFSRVLQAKMSIQYAVAAALLDGRIDEASYHDLDDPARRALAAKIDIASDDAFSAAFPRQQGAAVEVFFADGRTVSGALPDVRAADAAHVAARFLAAATEAIGADTAHRLRAMIADGATKVADLMALTRAGERRGAPPRRVAGSGHRLHPHGIVLAGHVGVVIGDAIVDMRAVISSPRESR